MLVVQNLYLKGTVCFGPLGSVKKKVFVSNKRLLIQSTLVISKSKGPSETLRDIRSSTHQMWRIEENTNLTTLVRNIC